MDRERELKRLQSLINYENNKGEQVGKGDESGIVL